MITTTEQVITDESLKKRQIINPNIIKIRIMGTVEDIEWLKMVLKKNPFFNVIDQSDIYRCNGTKKYHRTYLQVRRKGDLREVREKEICKHKSSGKRKWGKRTCVR